MYAVDEQPMSPHSPYHAYEEYQSSPHYALDLQQVLQNEAENELNATLSCRAASERRRLARQPPMHPVSPPVYPCAPLAPPPVPAEEDAFQDCDYEDLKHPDKPFPRPGQATDIPLDELVDRVKRGQRASAEWKARWWAWCDVNGGTRDPAKLPYKDLCMAVAQCGEPPLGPLVPANAASPTAPSASASPKASRSVPRGVFPPAPVVVDSPYHAELVHKIKIGQKVSESWKAKWWQYCSTHLTSTYDPTRHPLSRLLEALKEVGFPPDVPDAETTFEHEELVEKVKALQRTDQAFKAAWGDYCEEHGKGRRDPAKHTLSFIVRALEGLGQTQLLR